VWFAEPEKFRSDHLAALVTATTGGELHVVLAPQPVWLDDQEAAAAKRELAELRQRYDDSPDNADEPSFREIAELLSTPVEARYGWIAQPEAGSRLGVLAAGSPWFGLIAVREDESIWVRTFRDENLGAVLAAALPEWWKPTAQPISVLRSAVLDARREVAGAVLPSNEVRRAQRLADLPAYTIAEFHAETRDSGGRHRSPMPLRVYDNDEGRWIMRVTELSGDERVELLPANSDDLVGHLDTLRRQLVGS
jgi:hypothetical protein